MSKKEQVFFVQGDIVHIPYSNDSILLNKRSSKTKNSGERPRAIMARCVKLCNVEAHLENLETDLVEK